MGAASRPTLSGHDYRSAEVYEVERERIFHREWFYVGRREHLDTPGDRLVADVAGESVLVVTGRDGRLRGFQGNYGVFVRGRVGAAWTRGE